MAIQKVTKSKKVAAPKERYVLVTTSHRGVFAGYASDTGGSTIKLRRGRNVIYWSQAMKGFEGLAAFGPDAQCRIGPAVDIEIRDITSVSEVSADAIARFEASPWG